MPFLPQSFLKDIALTSKFPLNLFCTIDRLNCHFEEDFCSLLLVLSLPLHLLFGLGLMALDGKVLDCTTPHLTIVLKIFIV